MGERERMADRAEDMVPSFELPHHQNALSCYSSQSFLSFSSPFIQKETIVFASESKFFPLSLPLSPYLSETLHDLCHYMDASVSLPSAPAFLHSRVSV